MELSVVIPCLNEIETLSDCIALAMDAMARNQIDGEVLVADNGSDDGSIAAAKSAGAVVENVADKGYGSALLGGIASARGRYVIMADGDSSYDFGNLMPFVEKLREGYDLVMGNRFAGGIAPGAMPFLHRYLGNPVLTAVGRLFFGSPCGDFHCGMRGFSRAAIIGLDLKTTGMEFATEMIVKATLLKLKIVEVPTTLSPDGRSRPPHLRTWRDGWRHLRFLLLYSPRWLFLYPGIAMIILGLGVMGWLLPGPRRVAGITLDVNTLLYAAIMVMIGVQSVFFSLFTRIFTVTEGLLPPRSRLAQSARGMGLEQWLLAGLFCFAIGLAGSVRAVGVWQATSFGPLDPVVSLRLVIPSAFLLFLGGQLMLAGFFLGVLAMKRK